MSDAPSVLIDALGLPIEPNGQQQLPFRLTGSQAKTAYALRRNADAMICGNSKRTLRDVEIRDGDTVKTVKQWIADGPEFLNGTVFLTLTVGDETPEGFRQVWDAREASRRINNLNRRVLSVIFERAIIVSERHQNHAIHFHVLGLLKGVPYHDPADMPRECARCMFRVVRPDVRTGFDFKAFRAAREARECKRVNVGAEIRYKTAASSFLRAKWEWLRGVLPANHFGRAELTPIEKTGEAVACYVAKYIEKNICNRLADDKGKRLVRYIGDWSVTRVDDETGEIIGVQNPGATVKIRPNDFGWCSKRATAWRCKARELAAVIFVRTPEDAARALGPRWAYWLTSTWQSRFKDDELPFFQWTRWHRRKVWNDLCGLSKRCGSTWIQDQEFPDRELMETCEDLFFEIRGRNSRRRTSFDREIPVDETIPEAERELLVRGMEAFSKHVRKCKKAGVPMWN